MRRGSLGFARDDNRLLGEGVRPIAYLNGTLLSRDGRTQAVVVCGGVGLHAALARPGSRGPGPVGQTVALHVHNSLGEGRRHRFLLTASPPLLFQLLLSVPKCGPQTISVAPSSLPPSALSKAVQHSDFDVLTRVKGIRQEDCRRPCSSISRTRRCSIAAATAHLGEFHVAGHGERPAASADELVSALLALSSSPPRPISRREGPRAASGGGARPPVAGSASCSPSGVSCDRVPPCPRAPSSSPVPFSPAGARRKPPLRRPQASPRHRARRRRRLPQSPPSTSFSTAAITSSATSAPTGSSRTRAS